MHPGNVIFLNAPKISFNSLILKASTHLVLKFLGVQVLQ
jgi:hypothetical protein